MVNEHPESSGKASKLAIGAAAVIAAVCMGGILLPLLRKNMESQSRTQCKSNLNQIGKALKMYADVPANLGRFPARLEDLYPDFIGDENIFVSPLVPEGQHRNGRNRVKYCDYFYIPGRTDTHGLSGIAFSPKDSSGDGRNLLLGAGSVEWVASKDFEKSMIQTLQEGGMIQKLEDGSLKFSIPQNATPEDKAYFEAFARELGLNQ